MPASTAGGAMVGSRRWPSLLTRQFATGWGVFSGRIRSWSSIFINAMKTVDVDPTVIAQAPMRSSRVMLRWSSFHWGMV